MSNPPTMVIETSSSSRGEAQALPRTRMVDTVDDAPELRRVSHNGPAPPAQPLPRQPMHVSFEPAQRRGPPLAASQLDRSHHCRGSCADESDRARLDAVLRGVLPHRTCLLYTSDA